MFLGSRTITATVYNCVLALFYVYEMVEARVFKFHTQVGRIKYYPWDDKLPPNGRGQSHVNHLRSTLRQSRSNKAGFK